MRAITIQLAEVDRGRLYCPKCKEWQSSVSEDTNVGIFQCSYCDMPFEIDRSLLDKRSTLGDIADAIDEIDSLKDRVTRLEEELGIK